MKSLSVIVGEQIRIARENEKLSQAALGKKIGKTAKTISSYETGRRMMPVDDLSMIAEALNVSVVYFFQPLFVKDGETDDQVNALLAQMPRVVRQHWINTGQIILTVFQHCASELKVNDEMSDTEFSLILFEILTPLNTIMRRRLFENTREVNKKIAELASIVNPQEE